MNEMIVGVGLALLGAALGSFVGATLWRLRARELADDKAAGEKVNKREYKRLKPLMQQSFWKGRSLDLDTGKQLAWYDLIPVVSWLALKGKSRFSGKPIGYFELVIELAMAAFFVGSFVLWPQALDSWQAITLFALWLASGVGMAVLFAYDVRWYILPDRVVYPLIVLGLASFVVRLSASPDIWRELLDTALAVLILAGLYFVLHTVSKGKWVGFGDVKLGVFLGLMLGTWPLALLCLFLANFIGCLYVIPAMLLHKIKRTSRVPFGPFLMIGFVIAMLFGHSLVEWYMEITFRGVIAVVL